MPEAHPPGRAGHLWLRSRIVSTRRNLDLLDRKRRLLRRELDGLLARRDRANQAWREACADARTWGRRVAALGPASDLDRAAAVIGPAEVAVEWMSTIGVRHPVASNSSVPVPPATFLADAGSALSPAATAHRRALEAGAAASVADRWYQIIRAELDATERRTRAIERLRLPALEGALRELELRLEELERGDRAVTRWAAGRRSDGGLTGS